MEIYADGADLDTMLKLNEDPAISGFTTNPTLMREAGITDYEKFAKEILTHIKEKPVSFEVFADEYEEMERQAFLISSWGENVYVKIPITNTRGYYNLTLMARLSIAGIKINATAITEASQIHDTSRYLSSNRAVPAIISVFAGRIADTGKDPAKLITLARQRRYPNQKILWASTREVYNIVQAEEAGADIITVTPALFEKMKRNFGRSLVAVSMDTVKQFYEDAKKSGYSL